MAYILHDEIKTQDEVFVRELASERVSNNMNYERNIQTTSQHFLHPRRDRDIINKSLFCIWLVYIGIPHYNTLK